MSQTKLILSGSIAIDRIMSFNGRFTDKIQPDKLDVLSVSILIDELEIAHGGIGANISRAAVQLGMKPILLGAVGPDGKEYLQELQAVGIDTAHVHRSKRPTAMFSVITDLDHNQVGGFYPGAMSDSASVSLKPWQGKDAIVCISAHDPEAMCRQVQECKRYGLRLFYDPGQQANNLSGEDLSAGCDVAEIVVVNDYELGQLIKKIGKSADQLEQSAQLFITTHSKDGSTLAGTSVKKQDIPAAKPDKVVDPTGAGDMYRVGLLYGLINNWELVDCARLGSVIASFNVESPLPVPTLSRDAIVTRYKQTFDKEITLP